MARGLCACEIVCWVVPMCWVSGLWEAKSEGAVAKSERLFDFRGLIVSLQLAQQQSFRGQHAHGQQAGKQTGVQVRDGSLTSHAKGHRQGVRTSKGAQIAQCPRRQHIEVASSTAQPLRQHTAGNPDESTHVDSNERTWTRSFTSFTHAANVRSSDGDSGKCTGSENF